MNKIIRFVCLGLIVIFSVKVTAQYSWTQKASLTTHGGRSAAAGFSIGHYGFIGCGQLSSGYTNDFWRWNQDSNTWTAVANYPGAGRLGMTSFSIAGKGYCCLGWTGSVLATDLWEYDTATNAWTQKASFPGAARYGAFVFVIGTKAYIGCGEPNGAPYFQDVWVYDAVANSWTQVASFPGAARTGPIGFSLNGYGYAGCGNGPSIYNDMWKYDTTSNTWSSIASLPIPGDGLGSSLDFVIDSLAYVGTGVTTSGQYTRDFWSYSATTNTWTSIATLPGFYREAGVSFSIRNKGYIGMGDTEMIETSYFAGGDLSDFWEYVPKCALPIPIILGSPSVCSGGVDTLTATGGTSYVWEPGRQPTATIVVPSVNTITTYTVTVINSCGSVDTTINVVPGLPPIAALNANQDSICSGDTVVLIAGGGGGFVWSTGAKTSSIKVAPMIDTSYTVHVYTQYTTCTDSAEIPIIVTPRVVSTINLSADSICPGASTILNINSNTGSPAYFWSTGSTSYVINVNPATTTTYYVLVEGYCANDSISKIVTVIKPAVTIISPDTVCKGSTTLLSGGGASKYSWSIGSTSDSVHVMINNDSTITLVGTEGNCSDSVKKQIQIYSGNIMATNLNDSVCAGSAAKVIVSVSGGNHVYQYAWNNGMISDTAKLTPPPNQYVCTVTDGCGDILMDTVNLITKSAPSIAFYPTPDTIIGGGFINFVNLTTGAAGYYWNLGDGTTAVDTTPFHEYNEAGVYKVTLVGINSSGCRDTLTRDVYVIEKILVPNVFTPNGDGINDVFHITAGSMQTFDVQIYDRWGDKIFESESPNIDWTGRSYSGEMEADGTYYYVIRATDYSGKDYTFNGYVQLIR